MASLFERLEATSAQGGTREGEAVGAPGAGSVLASVRRILNARQGSCPTRRDLGLPDLKAVAQEASDAIPAIGRAVKAQIERFEPRLRQVVVRPADPADTPGSLAFAISAVLADAARPDALRFQAVIARDGQVRLTA